ncbi:O-acetyl-ADP-ribose deacetylase MACROD2 [Bagarius yarrelli]|uniref:O-acetyl-ADP-ribose deacetylase MACROD2 n=1 Tax=Bagarius yarrelli TaxID=175774 RepID=A0A556U772_BAGYA|nr:O-acetyl-ADP-ribose deacetylase MACROD2 [Bagarius yarrelli]
MFLKETKTDELRGYLSGGQRNMVELNEKRFRESEEEQEIPVSLCDKVSLYKGDITILEVDAIVNAGKCCAIALSVSLEFHKVPNLPEPAFVLRY